MFLNGGAAVRRKQTQGLLSMDCTGYTFVSHSVYSHLRTHSEEEANSDSKPQSRLVKMQFVLPVEKVVQVSK